MNSSSRNKGFTLLELLIAIVVLVFISFAVYRMITETFKRREIIMTEGDFYNAIRLSMNVLQRDIEQAYTPTQMITPKATAQSGSSVKNAPEASEELPPSLQGAAPTQFFSSPIDKSGLRPMRFVGKEAQISFISASHIRLYKNAKESDFNKVVYSLERETDPDLDPSTQTLVKFGTPNAFLYDEDKDNLRKKYPLLHGISRLKYRYYRKDKDQWLTSWDSDTPDLQYRLPDMVEVNVEVVGPKGQRFDGLYRFRPEIPFDGLDPSS